MSPVSCYSKRFIHCQFGSQQHDLDCDGCHRLSYIRTRLGVFSDGLLQAEDHCCLAHPIVILVMHPHFIG
jgi:hypothetical protein